MTTAFGVAAASARSAVTSGASSVSDIVLLDALEPGDCIGLVAGEPTEDDARVQNTATRSGHGICG